MTTLTYTTLLSTLTCGECSVPFAIPDNLHAHVRQTGQTFWCPNGHKISYGQSENDKLRTQLRNEQGRASRLLAQRDQERARGDHEAARARGYKGQLTKTKKRIGRGVCPACNRHFADVERHMAGQHPGYCQGETDG